MSDGYQLGVTLLGDLVFDVAQLLGPPAAIGVTEPLTTRSEYLGIPREETPSPTILQLLQLQQTVDQLTARVAVLEARTLAARWARFTAQVRRWLRV